MLVSCGVIDKKKKLHYHEPFSAEQFPCKTIIGIPDTHCRLLLLSCVRNIVLQVTNTRGL